MSDTAKTDQPLPAAEERIMTESLWEKKLLALEEEKNDLLVLLELLERRWREGAGSCPGWNHSMSS